MNFLPPLYQCLMETFLSLAPPQSHQYSHAQRDQDSQGNCSLLGRIGVRGYCSHEATSAPTFGGSACNSTTNAKGGEMVYPECDIAVCVIYRKDKLACRYGRDTARSHIR